MKIQSVGFTLPKMQLRGNSVLTYGQYDSDGRKGLQLFRSLNMAAQKKQAYSGRLTAGAKKRLTKAITIMVEGTRRRWIFNPVSKRSHLHQLTFVTLTVSDTDTILDGKQAYKTLLAPFLQWLRKTKQVDTYIWKGELQDNGQIHYHVTLPNFIHFQELRDKWNELQKKAGIIDKYRERQLSWHRDGFKLRRELLDSWPAYKQLQAYNKGMETDWQSPNSTDVHKVYKIKDVAGYLIKEIAKSCQNSVSLGGKVWDCSANLSQAKHFVMDFKEDHFQFCEMAVEEGLATKYEGERFAVYKFKEEVKEYLLTAEEMNGYRTWLEVIRESISYNDPPDS